MKVAVYRGINDIRVEEQEIPRIGEEELLLGVKSVGICGTDIKTYKRGHPFFKPPCVLGHEVSGVVVEAGNKVQGTFIGKKVVVAPYINCGKCDICRRGLGELCKNKGWIDGAFAEYIRIPGTIVDRNGIYEIPEEISFDVATLTEPLACAINGIQKAGVRKKDRVLVVGAGPMGLLLAIYARSLGSEVALSEINVKRQAFASRLGYNVIDPNKESLDDMVKNDRKFNTVILANDKHELVGKLLPLVESGGKLELFGGMRKGVKLEVDPYHIHYREVSLIGNTGFSAEHFEKAFEFLKENAVYLAKLITASFPLKDILRGFDAAQREENIKVVIEV